MFSEVAISTVSRKTGNTACVCKISGVWIGKSAHRGSLWLHEKVEEAGFGEVHVPGAACAPWRASGAERSVTLLPDARKPPPWSVLAWSGARFRAGKLTGK